MAADCKILYKGGESEIVEKKSRFIATTFTVRTEEVALEFIESIRKKYWDARHHCYAYIVGGHGELRRCSDDGEPSGTAGKPMLDVLAGEELRDALVVVTRYFGGTLLGTGGLVRAYSGAARKGLEASVTAFRVSGVMLHIATDYTGLGKIQYILGKRGISALDSTYTDKVELKVLVSGEEAEAVKAEIMEGTNGKARTVEGDRCQFADIEGEPVILDIP